MDILKEKIFQKKYKNISSLSINSLFKFEKNIINHISELEDKNKELDIIYLNYFNLKKQINCSIEYEKNYLIEIKNKKDNYDINDIKNKLSYLKKEYTTLLYQTNIISFVKKTKELEEKIILITENTNKNELNSKLYEMKQKRNKIVKTSKQTGKQKTNIYSRISIDKKICWYEKQIELLTQNKMILDNHIYCLENLYKDCIRKRKLDTTSF